MNNIAEARTQEMTAEAWRKLAAYEASGLNPDKVRMFAHYGINGADLLRIYTLLDLQGRSQLMNTVAKLAKEQGITDEDSGWSPPIVEIVGGTMTKDGGSGQAMYAIKPEFSELMNQAAAQVPQDTVSAVFKQKHAIYDRVLDVQSLLLCLSNWECDYENVLAEDMKRVASIAAGLVEQIAHDLDGLEV